MYTANFCTAPKPGTPWYKTHCIELEVPASGDDLVLLGKALRQRNLPGLLLYKSTYNQTTTVRFFPDRRSPLPTGADVHAVLKALHGEGTRLKYKDFNGDEKVIEPDGPEWMTYCAASRLHFDTPNSPGEYRK